MAEGNFHPEGLISRIAGVAKNIGKRVARPVAGGMVLGGGIAGAAMETPPAFADTPTPVVRATQTVTPAVPTVDVRRYTEDEWKAKAAKTPTVVPTPTNRQKIDQIKQEAQETADMAAAKAELAKSKAKLDALENPPPATVVPVLPPPGKIPVEPQAELDAKAYEAYGKHKAALEEEYYQKHPNERPKPGGSEGKPAGNGTPLTDEQIEINRINQEAKDTADKARALAKKAAADAALEKAKNPQASTGVDASGIALGVGATAGLAGLGALGVWGWQRRRRTDGTAPAATNPDAAVGTAPATGTPEQERIAGFQSTEEFFQGQPDQVGGPGLYALADFRLQHPNGTVAEFWATQDANLKSVYDEEQAKKIPSAPAGTPGTPTARPASETTPTPAGPTAEAIKQRREAAVIAQKDVLAKFPANITDPILARYVEFLKLLGEDQEMRAQDIEANLPLLSTIADVLVGNSGMSMDDFTVAVLPKIPAAARGNFSEYLKGKIEQIKAEIKNEEETEDEKTASGQPAAPAASEEEKAVLKEYVALADTQLGRVNEPRLEGFVHNVKDIARFGRGNLSIEEMKRQLAVYRAGIKILRQNSFIKEEDFVKAVAEELPESLRPKFLKAWEPEIKIIPDEG